MADRAHILTDKELEEMERHLSAIYARAEKELQEKADKYFKRFEELDAKKRALVDSGKLSEKEYRRWRKNKIMTGRHWTAMKEQVADELARANKTALEYVNGRLPSVYSLNYNSTGEAIEGAVSGYSFELVDASTVKHLATADRKLLPYKHLDIAADKRWNMQTFQSEVLQGIIQGESVQDISKRIFPEIMSKTDLTGKTDKEAKAIIRKNKQAAIRNARTMVTGAENKGRMDSLHAAAEKGVITHKVWLAAIDARTREAHRLLDGQEQEIDDPFDSELGDIMYPGDPDADPANVYNCFIGETNIASDSEIVRSYKHEYSGKLVTVKTAGGVNFTCTPNHPILTVGGWVKAESLQNGDNLIVTFGQKDFSLRINPNVNHAFPRIDAIHEFLDKTGGKRTCSLSVDFHGDIPTSDVEIITKKGLLREGRNSSVFNSINKFLLKHTDKSFLRDSTFVKHFWRVCKSALCIVSGFSKAFPLVWRSLRHSEIHRFRPIALLYSDGVKPLNNDVARNAELLGECLNGFSGVVFADNIVSVDFSSGCSHVYNLQTENGYYFVNSSIAQSKQKSNGIFAIAHNCRCTLTYKVVGFEKQSATNEPTFNFGEMDAEIAEEHERAIRNVMEEYPLQNTRLESVTDFRTAWGVGGDVELDDFVDEHSEWRGVGAVFYPKDTQYPGGVLLRGAHIVTYDSEEASLTRMSDFLTHLADVREKDGWHGKSDSFFNATGGIESMIVHEYGHALAFDRGFYYGGERYSELQAIFSKYTQEEIGRYISIYASTNPQEMFAEAFVLSHEPRLRNKLIDELMGLL